MDIRLTNGGTEWKSDDARFALVCRIYKQEKKTELYVGNVIIDFATHEVFICYSGIACSLPWDSAVRRNAAVHRGQSRPRCKASMSSPWEERAVHLAERSKSM